MVVQTADGITSKYLLIATRRGPRLVKRTVSYDLLTMVRECGWRIHDVKSDTERKQWKRVLRDQRVSG